MVVCLPTTSSTFVCQIDYPIACSFIDKGLMYVLKSNNQVTQMRVVLTAAAI